MSKLLLSLLIMIVLSGCAGYGNSYKCTPSSGIRCKSIPEINAMIDNHAIAGLKKESSKNKVIPVSNKGVDQSLITSASLHPRVIRVPEETMTVFINAYIDADGTYHHDNILQVVVNQAYWKKRV